MTPRPEDRPWFVVAVIDDDHGFRNAVSGLLRSAGYSVLLYESAEEYLSDGSSADADCVLTDIQMPGMSGLELQRRLHALTPRLPVLVMTGLSGGGLKERAMASGAVCFLTKPFEEDELFGCLGSLGARQGKKI